MAWIPLYIHSNCLRPFLLSDETKSGKWLKPQPDASDEIFPFYISNAGKAAAKTGNKPGVTKGNQWIRLNKQVELLDTPGILWPKFEDQRVGLLLAFLGSINDEILEKDELASELADYLRNITPGLLKERYGIEEDGKKPYELLDEIAAARACLTKGGVNDLTKAARLLLDEFRGGKLGRITLEMPEKKEEAE